MENQIMQNTYTFINPIDTVSNFPASNPNPNSYVEENTSDDEYFKSLPIGYRFNPTHGELIVDYLRKKTNNEKLPRNRINVVNLYEFNPEELADQYKISGEDEMYFFTHRERKYKNGKRPNRAAGNGYWKASGADCAVEHNGVRVGYRKSLVYYKKKPHKDEKTNWLMTEYTVIGPLVPQPSRPNDMRLGGWVLCKIRKNMNNTKKRRKNDLVDQDNSYIQDNSYDNTVEDRDSYDQQNKRTAREDLIDNASHFATSDHNIAGSYFPNNYNIVDDQGLYVDVQENKLITGQGPMYYTTQNATCNNNIVNDQVKDSPHFASHPLICEDDLRIAESFLNDNSLGYLEEDITHLLSYPNPTYNTLPHLSMYHDLPPVELNSSNAKW